MLQHVLGQLCLGLMLWQKIEAFSVSYNTIIATVNDVSFFVGSDEAGSLASSLIPKFLSAEHQIVPVTIIDASESEFTDASLAEVVASNLASDDVFNDGFSKVVYVRPPMAGNLTISTTESSASDTISVLKLANATSNIPAGPYFLSTSTGALYIPYRLYSDVQHSFTQGLIPQLDGSFGALPVALPGSATISIAVPSRLYYTPSEEFPLAGVRIGVKDIYDIKGIKTGAGSRGYYDVYSETNVTAPAVQRLIDAGAVIIGKMKTTQFAAPENARDSIDQMAAFNPRGDGYQEPGSSSIGPGTGVASYEWLDIALGSDTGGSIRVPAENNGIFGNRPTHGLVELTNVIPLAPTMDTAGFLVRDPKLWSAASKVLYSNLTTSHTRYPSSILTYDLPSIKSPDQTAGDQMIVEFVQKLANYLSANVSANNYTEDWIHTHPNDTPADLQDFVGTTWATLCVEQIKLVRDPFFEKYAAKYNGRVPFVNPSPNGTWSYGDTLSPAILDVAVSNQTIFADWFNDVVLPTKAETCSQSLFLYRFKNPVPAYRNAPGEFLDGALMGLNTGFIPPLVGTPDYALPIGQVSYYSSITLHEEVLPVSLRMMAAKGCDLMLLDLINDLVDAGIVPQVTVGNSLETGGPIYL